MVNIQARFDKKFGNFNIPLLQHNIISLAPSIHSLQVKVSPFHLIDGQSIPLSGHFNTTLKFSKDSPLKIENFCQTASQFFIMFISTQLRVCRCACATQSVMRQDGRAYPVFGTFRGVLRMRTSHHAFFLCNTNHANEVVLSGSGALDWVYAGC